jgi:yopX protein|nr:MAG TPA: YopX protein [Caudoviricetes sp.]
MLQPKIYSKKDKKVLEVVEIDFDYKLFVVRNIDNNGDNTVITLSFSNCEFMDNTGFKDKNGANIYTGNIVEYVRRHPDVGTLRGVICKNEYGAYVIELYVMKNRMDEVCETIDKMLGSKVEYEKPNLSFLLDGTTHDGCVVLGNIYEDKELLEC